MKQDNITKLYEGLTSKEKAALAFKYLTDLNETEMARIESTVQRKTYECADLEYCRWTDGIFHVASFWAIQHWQLQARWCASVSGFQAALREELKALDEKKLDETAIEKVERFVELVNLWESRLLALDKAMEAVCSEHGIDPAAVRKIAETEPFTTTKSFLKADQEYLEKMKANLSRVLKAHCQA